MKNPLDWACAVVDDLKLTGYLLNMAHPEGKSKAKYLRGHGFGDDTIDLLRGELITLGQSNAIVDTAATTHGIKYTIDGGLTAPDGVSLRFRTVWIIDAGKQCPRFVTGYPVR